MNELLFQPITKLLKLQPHTQDALKRLGIETARDLLFHKPSNYITNKICDGTQKFAHGEQIVIEATVHDIEVGKRGRPTKVYTETSAGPLVLVFFSKIPVFLFNKLRPGFKHIVEGKVEYNQGFYFQISHPSFIFDKKQIQALEPVYPLTYGITSKQIHAYVLKVLEKLEGESEHIVIPGLTRDPVLKNNINNKELGPRASGDDGLTESHEIPGQARDNDFARDDGLALNPNDILSCLKSLHIPPSIAEVDVENNIKELAKYELLANQIHLATIRKEFHKARGRAFGVESHCDDRIVIPGLTRDPVLKNNISNKELSPSFRGDDVCDATLQSTTLTTLGFTPTSGQEEVLAEIEHDQSQEYRMVRMLQGDVGSGKTLVALLSMLNVAASSVQSVLMAPTDLLASQHFEFFTKALENVSIKVALLTGKTKPKERAEILEALLNGEILILIGTHAVFQEKVNFKDLGYIIIDEQHRFGVEQRMELINKATMPDLLVMTATPIPRSLTLTLFGDMACSRLKSRPKGRLPIVTSVISRSRIEDVIDSLKRKIEKGEKIYWVCPLIEHAEISEEVQDEKLTDVATRFDMLAKLYPGEVAFVHGKMKNDAKDAAMQDFKNGKIKILVATTVIEVGIDVPDATLIIIENAEKFGLAQLHQLRGRVGRSHLQSHAVLMYEPTRSSTIARGRMTIMKDSDDGFYIAEQDLLLRGGGEILGLKQSGQQEFVFADLVRDMGLLAKCNEYANRHPEATNRHPGLDPGSSPQNNDFDFMIKLFARRENAEVLE